MQQDTGPLIDLLHITREVVSRTGKVKRLLSDVSWQLHPGQRVGVISGSMQEAHALLNCAAGITRPQQGHVSIQTHVSWPLGARGGMLNNLTGRENARLLQGVYGHGSRRRHDLEQIQFLADLEEGYFEKPLKKYNKSMRSRFNLAVSLAFDFDTYIIPKEFAWKSNPNSERLIRLQTALRTQTKGKSVLMANTDFDFLEEFCDEGVVLSQGSIAYFGSFADCRSWYETNINKVPEDDTEEDQDLDEQRGITAMEPNDESDDLW